MSKCGWIELPSLLAYIPSACIGPTFSPDMCSTVSQNVSVCMLMYRDNFLRNPLFQFECFNEHIRLSERFLDIDVSGWVPTDQYEDAKELVCGIKAKLLDAAETSDDVTEIRDHFPFDDFDENS
ncbi:hypothetical protein BO71DRAFT_428875 [Aspergillus ellipticus CBS 707.79]|uniref:Uncharacterized protein n=1 Tax=Aspergillus ellipticus CBS 707.79 TaxID=1448320 RepID=A0A319EVV5_9EURO|nr:hypothetical protein BO71DRAFT_428875 [Aspergillus ellipticus CBS 707.79]